LTIASGSGSIVERTCVDIGEFLVAPEVFRLKLRMPMPMPMPQAGSSSWTDHVVVLVNCAAEPLARRAQRPGELMV
jgi:hypothetical protein